MIGVRNNSDEVLRARHDGKDYEFAHGVTTALTEEAAKHIFGYGDADKTRALSRLGWLTNSAQYDQAVARLDGFQFLAVAEVKFEEAPTKIPQKLRVDDPVENRSLSEGEIELAAQLLAHPEGAGKKFGHK